MTWLKEKYYETIWYRWVNGFGPINLGETVDYSRVTTRSLGSSWGAFIRRLGTSPFSRVSQGLGRNPSASGSGSGWAPGKAGKPALGQSTSLVGALWWQRLCWVIHLYPMGLGFLHEKCDSCAHGSNISASTNFSTSLLFSSLEAGEETGAQRGDITGLREGLGTGIWSQMVFGCTASLAGPSWMTLSKSLNYSETQSPHL